MRRGQPQRVGDIVAQLLSRRSYARVEQVNQFEAAWQQAAAGPLAVHTRVGRLMRGTLEIVVANNLVMQELSFQQVQLLARLNEQLAESSVQKLKFRVGPVN